MPLPRLDPAASWYSLLHAPALRPLHTLVRTAGEKRRPGVAEAFLPARSPAADRCEPTAPRAQVGRERGRVPTIVLGGFVPDAGEQVFLLRRFLLTAGEQPL